MMRCYNSSDDNYPYYGERGIRVCEIWHESVAFIKWCDKTYIEGCTLDRKNNAGHYSPSNCKWSTSREQASNRRDNNKNVGVSYSRHNKAWYAQLTLKGKHVLAKYFPTEEQAVAARQRAEIDYL